VTIVVICGVKGESWWRNIMGLIEAVQYEVVSLVRHISLLLSPRIEFIRCRKATILPAL
jgi:hypothetical protein